MEQIQKLIELAEKSFEGINSIANDDTANRYRLKSIASSSLAIAKMMALQMEKGGEKKTFIGLIFGERLYLETKDQEIVKKVSDYFERMKPKMKTDEELREEVNKNLCQPPEKKERWKPKDGDVYYFLDESALEQKDIWYDYDVDNERYDFGNCFKTTKLANQARDLIKETLERFHESLN